MTLIRCRECGQEISNEAQTCVHCGCSIDNKTNNNSSFKNMGTTNKVIYISIGIVLLIGLIIIIKNASKSKIDVQGTSMYEYLLIEEKYGQDIDFSGVTSGANCFTGKQTKTVKTKKYGDVTIEFSYCKSNDSIYIHVYN